MWSYDFVHDQTFDGRSIRCLTVVDEFTRESLAVDCARSLTSQDVITALKQWLGDQSIGTYYIEPGSPWQNGYAESFNSIFRSTCLDRWAFETVLEARVVIEQWRCEYNVIRPHGSLAGRSPAQFIEDWAKAQLEPLTVTKVRNT